MELYAQALLYAIPFFSILIFIELIVGKIKYGNVQFFSSFDTISGISAGMTNSIRDILGISVLSIVAYPFLLQHINMFNIGDGWYIYLLTFISLDFAGYATHVIAHKFNYFWNSHVVHHSSERYTLACALRQPFIPEISVYAVFLIPAAILGLPAEIFAIVAPIHFFAQFWYHTELIGNLGFLEKIIVTPQQHSIHHAVNKEYMDKNFSQVFCIWDRIFGTSQDLIPGVKPIYGISRPARTWNPFKIGLQHIWIMVQDAWHTKNWADKFTIWFKPTGWRPADVIEKYPIKSIENPNTYKRYEKNPSLLFTIWAWSQLVLLICLMAYLFSHFSAINNSSEFSFIIKNNGEIIGSNLAIYSAFVILSIYTYTSVMDREKMGALWSILLSSLALYIMFGVNNGSWFQIENFIPFANVILIILFVFSSIGAILFTQTSLADGPHPELINEF